MPEQPERAALPPFALYLNSPEVWVGTQLAENFAGSTNDIVWEGAGPYDVPILARRDGFIIFCFDTAQKYAGGVVPAHELIGGAQVPDAITKAEAKRRQLAYRRFAYMNAFLQALSSAMSTEQGFGAKVQAPADPWNHLKGHQDGAEWKVTSLRDNPIKMSRDRSTYLKPGTLQFASDLMIACKKAFPDAFIDVLSLTYVACHQYSLHQFASAHLIGWSVVEKLLNYMWENIQHVLDTKSGGHTNFDKSRRKLLQSRDYTASVISQILSMTNQIDDPLLDRLNKTRKARNDFAHSLKTITAGDASAVIALATDLMSRLSGVKVTYQLAMNFWV